MLLAEHPPPLGELLLGRRGRSFLVPESRPREPQDAARGSPGAPPTLDDGVDRLFAMRRAHLFFSHRFQDAVLKQSLGKHLLEFAVLALQLFELTGLVEFHLPKLPLPAVKLTSEMLCARQTSAAFLPRSPSRRMRILSSVA